MIVVVKIGSSSITDDRGQIAITAVEKLCTEVAALRSDGHRVVVVTSGAIAAGLPALGMVGARPTDPEILQAVSAVGQSRLMRVYDEVLGRLGLLGGQVLLAPLDFFNRQQYVHASRTLTRLFELGVVPVVNENDVVADDEIRFGDNDWLAALVANLVVADLLVLLTDAPGVLRLDPGRGESGSLIQQLTLHPPEGELGSLIDDIVQIDHAVEVAGGTGSNRGSGGMATKLQAAWMAAWSGARVVIAAAERPGVLDEAVRGSPGAGTVVPARDRQLSARKLWIAFARESHGTIVVDEGARTALVERQRSLLPAGIIGVEGKFEANEAVEICGPDGVVFAKGLVRVGSDALRAVAGRRTSELPSDMSHEVVHRDDLVADLAAAPALRRRR